MSEGQSLKRDKPEMGQFYGNVHPHCQAVRDGGRPCDGFSVIYKGGKVWRPGIDYLDTPEWLKKK